MYKCNHSEKLDYLAICNCGKLIVVQDMTKTPYVCRALTIWEKIVLLFLYGR